MEGTHLLRDLLQPNDWMGKIDLKDAYFVIPIWENHSGEASLMRVVMLFRNERRRCESDAHGGGGGSGGTPLENFEI